MFQTGWKRKKLLIALLCLNDHRFPYSYSQYQTKVIRCQTAREKALVGNAFKLVKSGQFTMGFCLYHTLSIC